MIILKVDKKNFDEIEAKRSIRITDGKRELIFSPNNLTVIHSKGNNSTYIDSVGTLTINQGWKL